MGIYGYTAYCASKFALVGMAQALQMEVSPPTRRDRYWRENTGGGWPRQNIWGGVRRECDCGVAVVRWFMLLIVQDPYVVRGNLIGAGEPHEHARGLQRLIEGTCWGL